MATQTAMPLILGLVVALALIVAAIPLRRVRRSLGVGSAAIGGLMLGVLGTVAIIPLFLPSTGAIWANGLSDDDAGFRAEVPHSRYSVAGDNYYFRYSGTFDELTGDLAETYPEGGVGDDGVWRVRLDDVTYRVAPEAEYGPDVFGLEAQIAHASDGGDSDAVRIPFPVHEFGASNLFWEYPVTVEWSVEQWEAFYGAPATVAEGLPAFVIPTDGDGSAIVVVDGSSATVSRD
ncbi:hypothetical protein [Demequina zhanjiangensis]|uniref:DUF4190 domain-containing protein n=1 Tax=Demequina zhanjiangensis TaxID=3051659 RepID=A0ABT8G317_9MICO|nr:hypothetical protein [Demequina sp. SYSU T00b26]MDN4473472.1 hypothetical protein [Demequina sp. SYSU T00b26]